METTKPFTQDLRSKYLNKASQSTFDLLVIGGGITGAGIALDAISRGLSVVLIEKRDFASGTSSKSTKLVHGGLRYLKNLQFGFVKQLVNERELIYKNTRHLVIPTAVVLPIYKGGQLKKWLTRIALFLYDGFGRVKKEHQYKWLNKEELLKKYPDLKQAGLKGAYVYYEYRINDSRLVIELIKTAQHKGAICLNHVNTLELNNKSGKINRIIVEDTLYNQKHTLHPKQVINATGPWSDVFSSKFDTKLPKSLFHSKGAHILVSRKRFPLNEAFYMENKDKRMVFAIPRNFFVYIGTTDTLYSGDLDHIKTTHEDMYYLLQVANRYFPNHKLEPNDVISCWSGIRPLINQNKKGEISRRDEMYLSPSGLLSITGGKLTGYRLMAKKVVEKAVKLNNFKASACTTQHIRTSGSNWEQAPNLAELINFADAKYDEAKQTGIGIIPFKTLFYRYGTNIDVLIEKAYEEYGKHPDAESLWLWVEVWYAFHYEMIASPGDFFINRTEMVIFDPQGVLNKQDEVANILANFLNWDQDKKQQELDALNKHCRTYWMQD